MNKAGRILLGTSLGWAAVVGVTACHKSVSAAQQESAAQQGPDPTDQNMAPVDSSGMPVNASQQTAAQYSAGGAPIERRAPDSGEVDQQQGPEQGPAIDPQSYDMLYNDQDNSGQPPIEADQPPPELPVYDQPEAPAPNYIWTPGYWDYASMGYYWVPGVWVMAPYPGALWTPCYWGFYGGRYRFYRGYWGLHVGFYGGINYGFGYFGEGYRGGFWNGNNFYYNRTINRVSPRITNVYVRNVTIVNAGNRVSFNGGRGGMQVRPRQAEIAALRGPRTPPMSTQVQFQRQASENRQQFYNQNRGRPAMVATTHPVAADKGIQRPTPVQPVNAARPGFQNGGQTRPGQPANVARPAVQAGGESRPGQPGNGTRQGFQQGNENRPVQAGRPEVPPVQNRPQVQPGRPVPQQPVRHEVQPTIRPTPEARPAAPAEVRPAPQPYVRPTPEYRRETEQPRPASQVRTPSPQAPRPATAVHTAPPQQPRPAPSHVEPQERPH